MRNLAVSVFRTMAVVCALTLYWAPPAVASKMHHDTPTREMQPDTTDTKPQNELLALLPRGSHVAFSASGDVDGDGDEDMLLVLDSEADGADMLARTLWLLHRGADGRLHRSVQSEKAILCHRCGGMTRDPLRSIDIAPDAFALRFEGGSRELWSSTFRFAREREGGDWKLVGVQHASFDRIEGTSSEQVLTQDEIGEVSLAQFDASEFARDREN